MDLKQFSFTKTLKAATEYSRWDDIVTTPDKTLMNPPKSRREKIDLSFIELKHQLYNMLQFQQHVFYFFTNQTSSTHDKNAQFDLTGYSFAVRDGTNSYFTLKGLKGTPSCIGSGLSAYLKQGETIMKTQRVQNSYVYKIVVLIGLQEGFIKIIEFEIDRQMKFKHSLFSDKLEQKPIISITVAEKMQYEQKNICFILFEDNKVFIYNYVSRIVLCIYQPPILSQDHAIKLTLHDSLHYFATCTRSGQIIVWEITAAALEAISHSQDKELKKSKKNRINYLDEMQAQIVEYVWKFKPKDRVISVFPLTALHSASVQGLKWISFMGNLLATISSKGLFKLIALNFEIRDEYITIIEYQIEDGASISNAQLIPEKQSLIYFKSNSYLTQKTPEEMQGNFKQYVSLTTEQLRQKQRLLSNDNYYKANFKAVKNAKSIQNIIEKITFGDDLNISSVIKFYPCQDVEEVCGSKRNDKNKQVNFRDGCMSCSTETIILMCRNEYGFFIGPMTTEQE